MGNCNNSCGSKKDQEASGDEKFMQQLHPHSVKYLKNWKTKQTKKQKTYGITGRLRVEELKELVSRLGASVVAKHGRKKDRVKKKNNNNNNNNNKIKQRK